MSSLDKPIWIHNLDPIAFSLGPVSIHWYALAYITGIIISYGMLRVRLQSPSYKGFMSIDRIDFYLNVTVIMGLLGGRLGYAFIYGMDRWSQDILWVFRIWEGGMSFHGAVIGGLLAAFWVARDAKRPMLAVFDLMVILVPAGVFLGRIANFVNGELWGRPVEAGFAFGVAFPSSGDLLSRYPSQLYEACLEGLVLGVILWLISSKPRPVGFVSGVALVLYALFRSSIEFFREPDRQIGLIGGFSMGQWLSALMFFGGLGFIAYSLYRRVDWRHGLDLETSPPKGSNPKGLATKKMPKHSKSKKARK